MVNLAAQAVVAAMGHRQFSALNAVHWQQLLAPNGLLMDLEGIVPRALGALRL